MIGRAAACTKSSDGPSLTPEHAFTTLTSKRRKEKVTLTEITADQIRPGDVIVTEGRYGGYYMTVDSVTQNGTLISVEGVGRFSHASLSHGTRGFYSFDTSERVTVRR